MKTLGQRVKIAREAAGMTRNELAIKLGMPYSTLANIENEGSHGTKWIARIANILGVSPLWLETGSGPMRPTDPAPTVLPATIADLLAELEARIGPQPEAVRRAIAGLVAEYLVKPEGEREPLAQAIERMIGARR